MKKTGLSTLLHLLSVLLLLALTGCGASNLGNLASPSADKSGSVSSKLVWGASKGTSKTVAAVPTGEGITTIQVTISGSDATGKAIPVVRGTIDATTDHGTIGGIYPGTVTLAVKALAGTAVVYEGFAIGVVVQSGLTTTIADPIVMSHPVGKAQDALCEQCHETTLDVNGQNLIADFKQSGHYTNQSWSANPQFGITGTGCAGCHGPSHNDVNPAASGRCYECHSANLSTSHNDVGAGLATACGKCHQPHNNYIGAGKRSCVGCHAIGQNANNLGSYVNDNSGVRSVLGEFNKRSHHITGAAPTDAQCAVCHLEGKTDGVGGITVDFSYHMKDAKIHLRDVDHAGAGFAWDGIDHTSMDNFCFSCHDSDGAADLTTLHTLIPAATASNPFNDTLTNGYDQVARTGVVDVKTAFTTTNASHHAVSGKRYVYRFSTIANAAAWAARTGNPVPPASQVAEGHTDASPNGGTITGFGSGLTYDPAGPEEGGDATLYEAGKFVSSYTPLGASQNVGDNSTLHCGDCHTVGQWKAGSSTNADGSATSVTIGAHGSANEYLLRNSLGTDALHNGLTYVCFNCHKAGQEASGATLWAEKVAEGVINGSTAIVGGTYQNTADGLPGVAVPVNAAAVLIPTWKAGWGSLHPTAFAGQLTGYATSHAVSAMHAQCLADSANNVGATDRLAKSWQPHGVKDYDYLPVAGATATAPAGGSNAGSGNLTGIACTNCHNSGLRNGFGGIHGGDNTYVDGLGRTQKSYRFMPGMGNYRYAPPGGWDGKDVSDATLLTANNPLASTGNSGTGFPGKSGKPMGGCYTNGAADTNPGFSSCSHHGTSTAAFTPGARPTVSGATATFRATYGGGTTGSPTTFEPTVREATAGGTLVTRPLKY